MSNKTRLVLLGLLCVAPLYVCAGTPEGPVDQLRADFNDKTLGAALGAGGAAAGEPTDLSSMTTLIVQESPGNKAVQIISGTSNGRSLRWDFLGDAEITTGLVRFSVDFTPSALDRYTIGVRESGGSAQTFLGITLSNSGTITASDAAGVIPVPATSYMAGQLLQVVMAFDMDARTSSATINGVPFFSNRSHGITARGVGRLLTGFSSSNDQNPAVIDNVLVQTSGPLPLVLDADFNNQPVAQPLATGGASLNQPISIAAGITTQIMSAGGSDRVLQMSLPSPVPSARAMRWQFLDNIEVVPGVVAFEIDVTFASLNQYQFLVREAGSSGASYALLTFTASGQLAILDQGGSGFIPGASYQAGIRYRLRFTFDQAQGTYSALLNDSVLFADRAHGDTSGRGIGSLLMGFSNSTTAGASMTIDDLQVGASAAPDIASELAILQQPTSGTAGQTLSPTLEVGALNVFDQLVTDGVTVTIDAATGPGGAMLTQNVASTVAGAARFPNLTASAAGTYQLRARADRAEVLSTMPLTVMAPSNNLFRNGFEASPN